MKNLSFILSALVVCTLLTASCGKDKDAPVYTITVTDDGHGTAVADVPTAQEGATVKLTATPAGRCSFDKWTVESGSIAFTPDANTSPATFTMPAGAVSVKATFNEAYAVGDSWPVGGPAQGIVWWLDTADADYDDVTKTGSKGKVLHLDENASVKWDSSSPLVSSGTNDQSDGAVNMATIKAKANWETTYPAFGFCGGKGADWYLPAESELKALYAVYNGGSGSTEVNGSRTTFNGWLTTAEGTALGAYKYWTSTAVEAEATYYVNFSDGMVSTSAKNTSYRVRCVRKF